MERYFKINESELIELLHDSMKLMALENGGVDNWEWYGASIHDFIEANGGAGESLYDIARADLGIYEEINE